jgi:hypothetical protein
LFAILLQPLRVSAQLFSGKSPQTQEPYSKAFTSAPGKLSMYSIGAGFLMFNYLGDLSPSRHYADVAWELSRPGLSVFLDKRWGRRWSGQLSLSYGRIAGDDSRSDFYGDQSEQYRYIRNLNFRSDLFEVGATARWFLLRRTNLSGRERMFNPYVTGGFIVLFHNPQTRVPDFQRDGKRFSNAGSWVALQPLGTEGQHSDAYNKSPYSLIQPVLPLGGGLHIRLTDRLSCQAEIALRYTFTDYLDDAGGSYADLGAFDNELARALSDRSQEPTAALTGAQRDLPTILSAVDVRRYASRYEDELYWVFQGFGDEGSSTRSGKRNDHYIVGALKFTYILGSNQQNGKR